MHSFSTIVLPAFLTLAATAALAAKPYEEMDYGRFLSASYNNAEGKNSLQTTHGCTTEKGIAIKLGKDADATMLFDTDLLRMAGGWTGGWIKMKGVIFDGGHGPNPQPAENSQMFFETNRGPGWSKGDDFKDPRKLPTGPGAATIPFGPLPREWAKYKGLYLNGDQTVLAYTVGTADVLELPAMENAGDQTVLTRTFNVLTPGAASNLVLIDGADGATAALDNGAVILQDNPKNADSRALIGVQDAPAGATLVVVPPARVVLKLPALASGQKFKVIYWKGTQADLAKLRSAPKMNAKISDLTALTKGGPAHWTQPVETQGTLGKTDGNEPYVVDNVTVPLDNPYKSWMRTMGLDFFSDGRAALCTWSGDVWIVSGIDDKLEKLSWKRYATGLFHALGLKVVDDKVFVLGRDQITRLEDLNGDGEADFYANFNNDVQVTPGFHEFALDLHTDPDGNFYFAKGGPVNPGGRGWGPLSDHNGCVFKISKDGLKFEVFATGVRAPNGMCIGPNGEITNGDNQGTWVPACYLHMSKPGEFIGVVDLAHRDPLPTSFSPHICFFPMDVDNSGGCQVWVTSDKWGPMTGRLLHLSYGKSSLLGTMIESVDGTLQGGAFKFPLKFDTGISRARFNAKDGQLYVTGLRGWQTNGSKDGAFQRVRYTGKTACLPAEMHVTDKGIHLAFTAPLDAATAGDAGNYAIEQYNYAWTKEYGSPDFKVSDPKTKGRDPVEVKSAKLSEDKKSVFLEVPGLQPVMQMEIKFHIKSADGTPLPDKITNTINVVGKEHPPTAAR